MSPPSWLRSALSMLASILVVVGGGTAADGTTTPQGPTSEEARPPWASAAGQDQYGRWAEITVHGQVQRLRWIPAGKFVMGSPESEAERENGEVQHEVTLTQGYWLGATEVTQALWEAVMGSNPSFFRNDPQRPVERVSWDDCQTFLTRLNQLVRGGRFALPTEAQWEYACRAGTSTPFSFGPTITVEQADYHSSAEPYGNAAKGEYRQSTVVVGSLPCNAWGLHEMHGNVGEWCQDLKGPYPTGSVTDPTGPTTGSDRVNRGASWYDPAWKCRSAKRLKAYHGNNGFDVGLRLAVPSR